MIAGWVLRTVPRRNAVNQSVNTDKTSAAAEAIGEMAESVM